MNWDALGAMAEAIGALLVIASLVYLSIQVRQSNKEAEASAQSTWISGWNEAIKGWIKDDITIEAMRNGFDDFDSLRFKALRIAF